MNTKWKAEKHYQHLLSSYSVLLVALVNLMLIVGCGGSSNDPSIDIPISTNPPPEVFDDIETFTIDIKTATYSGNILHNGSVEDSQASAGELFIKGMDSQEESTALGEISEQSFERRLIQGTYQVEYFHQFGDDIPKNKSIVVKDEFTLTADLTEDINIESVTIGFNVLLNGISFPSDPTSEAVFYLKPVNGGEEVLLGISFISGQSVRIMSGDYQAVYRYIRGENIPINVDFTLPEIHNINTDTTLEININAVDVRVRFFTEGIKTDFNSDNIAHFLLKSSGAENMTDLGSTDQELISVPLIVGDYDLIYDYQTGDQIPINTNKKISEVSIQDGTVIEPIVDKVTLAGNYYHNGEVTSDSGLDFARIFLQNEDNEDIYSIGPTNDLSYENLNIIAGSYNIIYEFREGSNLPQNSYATLYSSVLMAESGDFDINIVSVDVTANVTLNGKNFPESGLSFGNISLLSDGDRRINLGSTNSTLQTVTILAGEYHLFYEAREFNNVPINGDFMVDQTFDLMEDGAFSYNFEAKKIRIETLVNGVAGLSHGLEFGRLYLEMYGEVIPTGATYESIERMIMIGEYDVFYEFRETQGVMPTNRYSKIATIRIDI